MKLFSRLLLYGVSLTASLAGCSLHRVDVHGRHGHIRHMRSRQHSPWYTPAGSGYSKHTNRKLHHWDRNLHK